MAKVIRKKNAVIKLQLDTLESIINPRVVVDRATANRLGETTKEKALELVAVGKSPIKGRGRFRAYGAQRVGSGYPETRRIRERFPGKKTRPVNLELDGTYLEAITQHERSKGGILFGLLKGTDFLKTLFKVHNEGARRDIPQRKVIPTGGDTFVPSIIREIKRVYLKRIRSIIRSGGN